MNKLFAFVVLLLSVSPAVAADANGYTAQYECRADGPNCSTDVPTLVGQSCQQTITASTPWSSINWSNNVICIEAGDHSSKGALTIRASGTASNRKILRYVRQSDNGDDPWRQSSGNRATIKRIVLDGASYWILHRLTVDGGGAVQEAVKFLDSSGASNNVLSRILVENSGDNLVAVSGQGNDNNTIQNSVLRKCVVAPGLDSSAVSLSGNARNTSIVNSEIYDCVKGIYTSEHGAAGTVIENNDIYLSPDMRTNCSGGYTPNGGCAAGEVLVGMKSGGTPDNIVRIVNNRMWGMRATDTSVCCAGGGAQGDAVGLDSNGSGANPSTQGAKYTLVQNNIIMDSQHGITSYWSGVRNNSIIGNILYDIRRYSSRFQSYAFASEDGYNSNSEWYLNTVIDSDTWINFGGAANNDIRCNVVINSGGAASSPGSGTQVSNNAFYATQSTATDGSSNTIARPQVSDARNTSFCFMRKLLTSSEQFCLPDARSTANSPHLQACAADIGTRTGIGISDVRP